jgi:hypothetical protein
MYTVDGRQHMDEQALHNQVEKMSCIDSVQSPMFTYDTEIDTPTAGRRGERRGVCAGQGTNNRLRCTDEMLSDVIEMSFADAQPVTRMLFAEPATYTRAPVSQPSYITNDGTKCMRVCVRARSVQKQHLMNVIQTATHKAWSSRLRLGNVFG